jgi:transposase-like protein
MHQIFRDFVGLTLWAINPLLHRSFVQDRRGSSAQGAVSRFAVLVLPWIRRHPSASSHVRGHLKATNKSWRVDETYLKVKGRWCYLYRAIDSAGATIDFLLSAFRDADAAKRLFRKCLSDRSHPQPRVINTDLAPIYTSAIRATKKEGTLRRRCRHRPVQERQLQTDVRLQTRSAE